MPRRACALAVVLALLSGCATRMVVSADPPGSRVRVDGVELEERTPLTLERRRSAFARDAFELEVAKEGYRSEVRRVEQVFDRACGAATSIYGVAGLAVNLLLGWIPVLPVVALVYMPWCSRLEADTVYVELEPLRD